jgi:hypothetical protein
MYQKYMDSGSNRENKTAGQSVMPTRIHDDDNGLDYTLSTNGYYLPDLLPPEPTVLPPTLSPSMPPESGAYTGDIGRYGRMRKRYLQEHHKGLYLVQKAQGELFKHLHETNAAAKERFEQIVARLIEAEGLTNEFKMTDQMAWVGAVNNIRHRAHEIVCSELIYV